jgi:hypothetical protein
MRLLKLEDNGEFSLTEYYGDEIPPYAILSHTWGPDRDEVTFKDLIEGAGKSKVGYQKIHFCNKQAAADNLQCFWVDTCSIHKRSSAELSESINFIFRWYHSASKCYVYLSDISIIAQSRTFSPPRRYGNQLSGKVDGSLEARHFKSICH